MPMPRKSLPAAFQTDIMRRYMSEADLNAMYETYREHSQAGRSVGMLNEYESTPSERETYWAVIRGEMNMSQAAEAFEVKTLSTVYRKIAAIGASLARSNA
jgi:hypothetical protein